MRIKNLRHQIQEDKVNLNNNITNSNKDPINYQSSKSVKPKSNSKPNKTSPNNAVRRDSKLPSMIFSKIK